MTRDDDEHRWWMVGRRERGAQDSRQADELTDSEYHDAVFRHAAHAPDVAVDADALQALWGDSWQPGDSLPADSTAMVSDAVRADFAEREASWERQQQALEQHIAELTAAMESERQLAREYFETMSRELETARQTAVPSVSGDTADNGDEVTARLASAEAEIRRLNELLAAAQQAAEAERIAALRAQADIATLTDQLQSAREEAIGSEARWAGAQSDLDRMGRELADARGEVDLTNEELTRAQARSARLSESVEEAREELVRVGSRLAAANAVARDVGDAVAGTATYASVTGEGASSATGP